MAVGFLKSVTSAFSQRYLHTVMLAPHRKFEGISVHLPQVSDLSINRGFFQDLPAPILAFAHVLFFLGHLTLMNLGDESSDALLLI